MSASAARGLSVNTATLRGAGDLLVILDAVARHGIEAVAPWRDQVAAVGLNRAVRTVRDAGLALSGYCRGGMFPADLALRREARDDNRRAVDEAAAFGSPCLILVAGGLPQHSRPGSEPSRDLAGARRAVEDGLAELLDYARAAAMPLAVEPLHPMYAADRSCVNTLGQALEFCDRLDPEGRLGLGVAVDVYHVWWDPDVLPAIARAGERILAFHICDWLVPTRDLLFDRGMMGDGVIDLAALAAAVEAAGFRGYDEVEIFSHDWWARPADAVLATCVARHAALGAGTNEGVRCAS